MSSSGVLANHIIKYNQPFSLPCKLWSIGKCLVSSKALVITGPLRSALIASTYNWKVFNQCKTCRRKSEQNSCRKMQKPLHYLYFGMISLWQIALRLSNHEVASRASHWIQHFAQWWSMCWWDKRWYKIILWCCTSIRHLLAQLVRTLLRSVSVIHLDHARY